jgi:hypothetical protein
MNDYKSTGTVLSHIAILVNKIQSELNTHYEKNHPRLIPPQVCVDIGEVFVRIYHHNITTDSIWAVCFVMLDTGNIRMPLGLKAFDRYNVGSVMDEDNAFSKVTSEGLIKPSDNIPSSYDPDYKTKETIKPQRKKITLKRNDHYDQSPEAEAARQREYGRMMRDSE